MSSARLTFLDSIRGIAAFAVMLEHTGTYVFPDKIGHFTHNTFSLGKFGVTLFFLVSGFVIPLSLEKGRSLKRFWIHRLCRLYPLYWMSLLAVVFLFLSGFSNEIDPRFASHLLRNASINATMLQEFVRVPHALGLYYTLTIEMAFYVACSMLLVMGLLRRAYRLSWLALSLCGGIATAFPLSGHGRVPMAGLFYIWTLSVGMVFFGYMKGRVSSKALISLLSTAAVIQSVAIYLNYVTASKKEEPFTFAAVFCSWFTAFVVFALAYRLRSSRFPRPLIWVGEISYSLYLLHPVVMFLFPKNTQNLALLATIDLLAITCAAVTFHLIERPFINLGVSLGRRLNVKSGRSENLSNNRPDLIGAAAPDVSAS